jgi:glyoxylase-like metal-dependent hydrolase (beta-lactamase superfamily II)
MSRIIRLALPVPYLGTVNLWLLDGEPLTLVDTGPFNATALEALETQLVGLGRRVEDIELLLLTHHHLDHTGLARTIRKRSGARVAATAAVAAWGRAYDERIGQERRFTERLLGEHAVPAEVIAATTPFFEHIVSDSDGFETDVVLGDGELVRAGARTLRVVERPGHSTTDTLFVDDATGEAFVGDHLLAEITSGAELMPRELPGTERRHALLEFLGAMRQTLEMPLATCYTGHGPTIDDHRSLITQRLAFHEERLESIEQHVAAGSDTAFEVARKLWGDDVAESQAVLAIWEVLGHLDVLVARGVVRDDVDRGGLHHFRAAKSAVVALM